MSSSTQGGTTFRSDYRSSAPNTAWSGWVIFAATLMVLIGGFSFIDGLIALLNSAYYGPVYHLLFGNYTSWGWWSLIYGAVLVLAGLALFSGQLWARILAIVLAVISALSQLVFIQVAPFWAVTVIAIDVVTIYALTVNEAIE